MKLQRLTNVSLYLGNDTRQSDSCCGTPIQTGMQSTEWCHFRWPWM